MGERQTKPPKPECLAIIICESVVEDVRSRNKSILNTYNTIFSESYPAQHDRFTVFASLTSGRGEMELDLRLVRDATQETLFGAKGSVKFPDPLAVVDITIDMRHIPIPGEGYYTVQLWLDDRIVGQRRIRAQLVKGGKKQ